MNTNPLAGRARAALRGVLLGAAVTLAAWPLSASAAAAGSIAFIKDGNVFLASPDGARTVPVTTSGAYAAVSQADDGTMIALTGGRLHTLSRTGAVLADFATPVSDGPPHADPNADHFQGPFWPRISPDGTRVAYTYYWRHFTWDPTCNGFQGCCRTRLESGTGITNSDRLTEFGGPLTGWKWATWIDNDRIVRGDPGVVLAEGAVMNRVAPASGTTTCCGGSRTTTTSSANRPSTAPAGVRRVGHGVDDARVVRPGVAHAPVPEQPEFCFKIPPQEPAAFGAPSFSPDGTGLAFQDKDGIHVLPLPADCSAPQNAGALVVPGASSPSWGPAGLPASAPMPGRPSLHSNRFGASDHSHLHPGVRPRPVRPHHHAVGELTRTARLG